MKTKQFTSSNRAFSAVDLLIIIATIVVIAGVVLPMMSRPKGTRSTRIQCVSNLKQVGLGFRLLANDGESYPRYNETNEVWQYFQTVGVEIGSPKVLLCPKDDQRTAAALDFETNGSANSFSDAKFRNNALSFFYGVDSSEVEPNTILAGDRNISTNNNILTGTLAVGTNTPVKWTKDMHKEAGNIALADGSVQQVNTQRLRDQFRASESTNEFQRLLIP